MKAIVLSLFRDPNTLAINGFRVFDVDTNKWLDMSTAQVTEVLLKGDYEIKGLKYDKRSKKLKCTVGDSNVGKYNWMNPNNKDVAFCKNEPIEDNYSVVVIGKYNAQFGYRVATISGARDITERALMGLINDSHVPVVNATIVADESGRQRVELVKDTFYIIKNTELSKKELKGMVKRLGTKAVQEKVNEVDVEIGKVAHTEELQKYYSKTYNPSLPKVVSGLAMPSNKTKLGEYDSVCKMTVEQKLTFSFVCINRSRAFYATVLKLIEKYEARPEDDIRTASLKASIPRTISATRRIFRGEEGILFNLA